MSNRTDAQEHASVAPLSHKHSQSTDTAAPSGNPHLFLAACGFVMLVGIMFLAWMGTAPVHSAVGKRLPTLALEPLVGVDQPVNKQTPADSALILHLWGPWSEESRAGFVAFAKLVDKLKGVPNLQVLSVAYPQHLLDRDQLRQDAETFLNESGTSLPAYVDVTGLTTMDLALIMPYGSLGFPTTFVVDSTGTIVYVMDGYAEDKMKELQQFTIKHFQ